MTQQVPDMVQLDGEYRPWFSSPYLPHGDPRLVQVEEECQWPPTNCYRGYRAAWEIREDRLYLASVSGKYELSGKDPLFAEWYTGTASVGDDAWIPRTLLHLEFDRGVVVGKRTEVLVTTPRNVADAVILLAAGADVNTWVDTYGKTMLASAIASNRLDLVEFLLGRGAAVGTDALTLAINEADPRVFRALWTAGDASIASRATATVLLHRAAGRGRHVIVTFLLAQGADVNAPGLLGATPLHECVGGCHVETATRLLSHGAHFDAKNMDGETALHRAAACGCVRAVSLLLDAGAQLNARDDKGRTPLHVACKRRQNLVCVGTLIERGANVNTASLEGVTPLHVAAFCSRDITERLLAAGAVVNARDGDGATPLHVAAEWGYADIAEVLLAAGADIHAATRDGCTALDYAIAERKAAVAQLLRGHGGA